MRIDPKRINRVLVIGLSCLGDMLLASAALWNLRLFLPDARFRIWAGPGAIAAVENDPLWDEVRVYDRHRDYPGVRGRLAVIREIRTFAPDLVIDLRSGLNPLFSGARYAPLWGLREMKMPPHMHEAERNLVAMASLGVPIRVRRLRFHVADEDKKFARDLVLSPEGQPPLLIVNPHCGTAKRRWPLDLFEEFARRMAFEEGFRVGVPGYTREERNIAERFLSGLGAHGVDLTRCDTLGKYAAALQMGTLFVTNDSGPMHLACALDVPVVALFGQTDLNRFGPWGTLHRTVLAKIPCAPCGKNSCKTGDWACMASISVNEVKDTCGEFLGEREVLRHAGSRGRGGCS